MAAPHMRTFNGASVASRTTSTNCLCMSAAITSINVKFVATSYLEDVTFAEIRATKERRKLFTSFDRSVVLGREAGTKHFGKPTIIPNRDLVVVSVQSMDQTLDGVSVIIQNEATFHVSHI